MARLGLVGEPGPVKRRKEPITGTIAGEDPPCAIGAMRGRRKADEDNARSGVAKPHDRPGPVALAVVTARRIGRDRLAPLNKPRAENAALHVAAQRGE